MHGTLKPLHCACMVADADCIELLLEKGAQVRSSTSLLKNKFRKPINPVVIIRFIKYFNGIYQILKIGGFLIVLLPVLRLKNIIYSQRQKLGSKMFQCEKSF